MCQTQDALPGDAGAGSRGLTDEVPAEELRAMIFVTLIALGRDGSPIRRERRGLAVVAADVDST